MGERAKKKRAAESRANRKAKKVTEQESDSEPEPGPEEGPALTEPTTSDIRVKRATPSNAKNSNAAPHVTSTASTRQSTRLLSSSSKLVTSAKGHNDEAIAARPQRLATVAANSLLKQMKISETENSDFEDPDGESNQYDNYSNVLISKTRKDQTVIR
jgi:hypothetical protein